MQNIVRNVCDMERSDRRAIEHVVGQTLRDDLRLLIQIINGNEVRVANDTVEAGPPTLPDWCNVYEGLSDDEVAEIEKIALTRADLGRPVE